MRFTHGTTGWCPQDRRNVRKGGIHPNILHGTADETLAVGLPSDRAPIHRGDGVLKDQGTIFFLFMREMQPVSRDYLENHHEWLPCPIIRCSTESEPQPDRYIK